jgi:arylsulfatase A
VKIHHLASVLALVASVAAAKPNVILIFTDDLGYGDLSCYGQRHFETPNIDRLASEGIRFTSHYAGTSVCAPSRCSLMTGFDTGHASIRGNGPFILRPDPEDKTIASLLRENGYETGLIGKSTVTGNTQTPETLRQKGFDYFYGTTDHRDGHFRFPKFVYENEKRIELEGNTLYAGPHYDVDFYSKKALEFVERQTEKPFFLVLSYPAPHASLAAPEDALARVRPRIRNEESYVAEDRYLADVIEVKATYAAMILRIDDAVGAILAGLKAKGLDDNTLVMFTTDNGSHSEGGYRHDMLDSNGMLRGGKRDLYEGGIRVPFVARWPKGVPAGRTTDHPSAFWDFLPTLCDLSGISPPAGIQGISYAPALTGKPDAQKSHETLYWELHEHKGRRALRMGPWKIVQYVLVPGAFGEPELYNLDTDLSEKTNIASQEPERVKVMVERMNRARIPNDRFPHPGLDGISQ